MAANFRSQASLARHASLLLQTGLCGEEVPKIRLFLGEAVSFSKTFCCRTFQLVENPDVNGSIWAALGQAEPVIGLLHVLIYGCFYKTGVVLTILGPLIFGTSHKFN